MSKIIFRNPIHAALFDYELMGQISDGFWSNKKPHDHWHWIKDLEVQCDKTLQHPVKVTGMELYPKLMYDFASPTLYKYVGKRMDMIYKIARSHGFEAASIASWYEMPDFPFKNRDNDYYRKVMNTMLDVFKTVSTSEEEQIKVVQDGFAEIAKIKLPRTTIMDDLCKIRGYINNLRLYAE